jgi:hypothetical protein
MRPLLVLIPFLPHLAGGCYQTHESTYTPSSDVLVEDPFPDVGDEPLSEVHEVAIEDMLEDEVSPVEDCTVDLDTFSPTADRAAFAPTHDMWVVQGAITPDFETDPFSLLSLESWSLDGGPTAEGTYEIVEPVSTVSCGLCLFVCEGCPAGTSTCSSCERTYVATRGTVEITEIVATLDGTARGALTDAYFAEVDWLDDVLIPDGRGVCLDLWAFDGVLVDLASW